MLLKLRPFAVLALVAVAAGFAWLFVSNFRYTGTPLWPDENTVVPAWMVYVVWEASLALPLLGFWLLFNACRRGGGRWWWRWWIGGIIVLPFIEDFVNALIKYDWVNPGGYLMTGHPWMPYVLNLAAVLPLRIVTARREVR